MISIRLWAGHKMERDHKCNSDRVLLISRVTKGRHTEEERPALKVHYKGVMCIQECARHDVAAEENTIPEELGSFREE